MARFGTEIARQNPQQKPCANSQEEDEVIDSQIFVFRGADSGLPELAYNRSERTLGDAQRTIKFRND